MPTLVAQQAHGSPPRRATYAGVFMVTLATLMYELLLTRIFSVTMWYHFAFVAISIAMFGMTVGAIIVYLAPAWFSAHRTPQQLAVYALLFSVTVIFSFLTHVAVPFAPAPSVVGVYSVVLTYTAIAVPFVASGICVCLALTRFPAQINKMYAADLAGAALGCIFFIFVLKVTDGATAVTVVAFLGSVGGLLFARAVSRRLQRVAAALVLLWAAGATLQTIFVMRQSPLIQLTYVKGILEPPALYEKWNSFSRIRVAPNTLPVPFGWGLSPTVPKNHGVKQLSLNIDATAATVLTAFNGDPRQIEHLKYDVINIAHYLRPHAKVLVVGTGGGRDVLSALAFGQPSVVGVEINQDILAAVNDRFGDFTGHLDRNPAVRFVNDEARSYIGRQRERFDIIQISLIDTWAATAAGAYVLAENSLYTVEAWKLFLQRLNRDGILTVSRWYFRNRPGEIYRMTTLASQSLKELGVADPRAHIIIVRRMIPGSWNGVGTLLVSKEPFAAADLDTIEEVAARMQFEIVLSPRTAMEPLFAELASAKRLQEITDNFPLDISPPRDDNPFFFHMLRLRDVWRSDLWNQGVISFNLKAVFILATLLLVVVGLTAACIVVPLVLTTQRYALRGAAPLILFFAFIGLGFMLVEISQLQRLIVFLGHPTYGLSVVLFSLLLSSGLGSYSIQRVHDPWTGREAYARLLLLLAVLVAFGLLTPYAIRGFAESTTPVRIMVAIAILLPLGLFMGMAFPLGMRLASARALALTPWLWGINGATSVCASVLAIVIALRWGIAASFWTGFACYGLSVLAFARSQARAKRWQEVGAWGRGSLMGIAR
jgi:hypothetical protein